MMMFAGLCVCIMQMFVICRMLMTDMKMIIIDIIMNLMVLWVIVMNLKMVVMLCWGWIRMGMTVTSITCFFLDTDSRWGDALLLRGTA